MLEMLTRFLVGGAIVTGFALLGNFFKPKSFSGLFGAAPSVALASLSLTVMKDGKAYASIEARSMIAGAIALCAYSVCVAFLVHRRRTPALRATLYSLPVWLGVALGLCHTALI